MDSAEEQQQEGAITQAPPAVVVEEGNVDKAEKQEENKEQEVKEEGAPIEKAVSEGQVQVQGEGEAKGKGKEEGEKVAFTVAFKKQNFNVEFGLDRTIGELRQEIAKYVNTPRKKQRELMILYLG